MKVHSDLFYWKKTSGGRLIAKLIMGDFQAEKEVSIRRTNTFTLRLLSICLEALPIRHLG